MDKTLSELANIIDSEAQKQGIDKSLLIEELILHIEEKLSHFQKAF